MQEYINQADHNQAFHDEVHEKFPNEYYDWKLTILFYVAIHLLKGLAAKLKKNIGNTHEQIDKSIHFSQKDRDKMPIERGAYDIYKNLYQYSRTARYDGMINPADFEEVKKYDHQEAVKGLRNFRLYIDGRMKSKAK